MDVSIGITAGGKSLRFGSDKRFALFGEKTFLEHAVDNFSSYDDVVVSLEDSSAVSGCNLKRARVVVDQNHEIGPIEALEKIISSAQNQYSFIFPVDMPLMNSEVVEYLCGYIAQGIDVVSPVVDGQIFPLCAIYSKSVLPTVQKLIADGVFKLRVLLEQVNTKYVDFGFSRFGSKVFSNINTREDYKKLLFPVVFAVSGYKKTGKTKVAEYLLKRFQADGYKAAAIKHDGHDYEMDRPGTDSFRFYETGSDVAIFSQNRLSINLHGGKSIQEILPFFKEYEVVIVEGLKDSALPKIQLRRENDAPLANVFLTMSGEYDLDEAYTAVRHHFGLDL